MRKYLGQSLPNIFRYGWLLQCTICIFLITVGCTFMLLWGGLERNVCMVLQQNPASLVIKRFYWKFKLYFYFFLLCRTLIKATRVMCSFLLLSLWPLHLFLCFSVCTTQQWVCCHELLQYSYSSVLLCPLGVRYLHRQVTGNHLDRLTVVQSICQTLS